MMGFVNGHRDQAEGLRKMKVHRPVRVIAVTSGKGGVGKTNISVNLAISLAARGRRTVLMDADLGLANIDILLGLHPVQNLSHVINGECQLSEILLTGPNDVQIIPAASGAQRMAELSDAEHAGLIQAFSDYREDVDVLIIDTAAGISSSVVSFCKAAQEVLVVVCDEPTSITDAYALIKLLSRDHGLHRFHILTNKIHSQREGQDLFNKLEKVTDRFLDVVLSFMGGLPYDDVLRKSIQRQKSVVSAYPNSKISMAFKILAERVDRWPMPSVATGQLEFFIERLVRASQLNTEVTL